MTHSNTTTRITADAFPVSPLALRTADPARQARVRAFATPMAEAAGAAARRLAAGWHEAGASVPRRVQALRELHAELIGWRVELAEAAAGAGGAGRLGTGIPLSAERFRMPIADRNLDRLGRVGRLRDGARWDPQTRTYQGGQSTPAYEAMANYGIFAEYRFDEEGPHLDVLQNEITLPRGLRLRGNQLLRYRAAETAAAALVARIAARGADASEVETGGRPIYTRTPDPMDAEEIFTEALVLLADAGTDTSPEDFRLARYMLFQAPRTKKGSDAVTRVFTVAVGALLFGPDAPVLRADEDLRSYVLGQDAATDPDGPDVLGMCAWCEMPADGCPCSGD